MVMSADPYARIGRAMRAMRRPAAQSGDALYREYAGDRDVYNRTWKPTPYEPRQAEVEQVAEDLGVDLDTARQIIRDVSSGGGDDQSGWQEEGFAISRTYSNALSQSPLLANIFETFTKVNNPESWSKPQPASLTQPPTPANRAERTAPAIDERDLAREEQSTTRAVNAQDFGRMRGEEQMAMPSMMAEADRMQAIEDSQAALRAEMEAQAMMAEENARMAAIEESGLTATRAMEGLAAQSPRGVTEGDFRTGPALVGNRRADLAPLDVPSMPSVAREQIGNIPGSLASRMAAEQVGRLGQFAAPGLPQSLGVLEGMRIGQVPVSMAIEDDVAPPSLIGQPVEVSRRAGQFASPSLAAARARAAAQDVEDFSVPAPNMEAARAAQSFAAAQLAEEMGIPGIDLATALEAVAADMARQNAMAAADVEEAGIPSTPFGLNTVAGVMEAGIPSQAFALNNVDDVQEAGIPTRGFSPNSVAGVREADIPSYDPVADYEVAGPDMALARAAQNFAAAQNVQDFGVPGPNMGLGALANAAQAASDADEFDVPAPNMEAARAANNAAAARNVAEFGVPGPGPGFGTLGDPAAELETALDQSKRPEVNIVDITGNRTGAGSRFRLGKVTTIVAHDEAPTRVTTGSNARSANDGIKGYHITFDEKGVYIHNPLNNGSWHATKNFATNSISVGRRGDTYVAGVDTQRVPKKGFPDKVRPLSPQERRNAAIAMGIAMQITGLGPESVKTHPQLGKAGTNDSRATDEGHWAAQAAQDYVQNKQQIDMVLGRNPAVQGQAQKFINRNNPQAKNQDETPPTKEQLKERTFLPPNPQQRSSLDALMQLFADLNPFGVSSAQAAGSMIGEGYVGDDDIGADEQSGFAVGTNSLESLSPNPVPALLPGFGVTGTGLSAGPGAGAGAPGVAGEGGGSGGAEGLGALQGFAGVGPGGQVGTNGFSTAMLETGANRGTIESPTGQGIGPGTFGAPGNPGGGGASGGGVGGRAGDVAGSASTQPSSDVTRGNLNDVQSVKEADIPSVAPQASAFATPAPSRNTVTGFSVVSERDLSPSQRAAVAAAREATARSLETPTMTGFAVDREGNVIGTRDVRGYASVGIPGTQVVGNLSAPLGATVNTTGPFAGLALSALADPEAEEASYAPYSVEPSVNFGNMVAGIPAGAVPGVVATMAEDFEAPVADLSVNPNAPFAGVALGQQALDASLASLASSYASPVSMQSNYGVQSEDTTSEDPDGGLPGGQAPGTSVPGMDPATASGFGNNQSEAPDGPGTTSDTTSPSGGGGDGNTPGTETTNYGEMGFGVFGGDGGQTGDTGDTSGGGRGGSGSVGGDVAGAAAAAAGLGSSPADGESTSGGPIADGGVVKPRMPKQYEEIIKRALRAARRSRAA